VNSLSINQNNEKDGDWDESAMASKAAKPAPSATNGPAEIKDMSAFGTKTSEQDDIAQRMRTEEIKSKLAAAKEGMKKEEQRLKEEQAAKESKKQENSQTSNRFGSAAAAVGGGIGSKWVPSHMRGRSTPAPGPRFGAAVSAASGGFQKKVDTNDEELFPDLATADRLIQDEEDKKAANAAAASAANRAKAATAKPRWGIRAEKKEEKKPVEKEEPKPEEVKVEATVPASAAPAPIKKKKKKKKDLSTFKSS